MISCLETDLEKGKVPEQAATRRDYRAGIFHIFSRKFQNDSGFRRKTLDDLTLEPFEQSLRKNWCNATVNIKASGNSIGHCDALGSKHKQTLNLKLLPFHSLYLRSYDWNDWK